jgi:hypothetical protein
MARRSLTPMEAAARRLPWRVTQLTGAPGSGPALDQLIRWCRAELPREAWFFPLPGGRTAHGSTDFAQWGFADQATAERFAAEVRRLLGEAGGVKVFERGTEARH